MAALSTNQSQWLGGRIEHRVCLRVRAQFPRERIRLLGSRAIYPVLHRDGRVGPHLVLAWTILSRNGLRRQADIAEMVENNNSSIEPSGDGIERMLARAQGLCYATLTLVQDVLHLIDPAASPATQALQLIFGGVHQPLASFFAGKERKKQSQANADAQPRQKSNGAPSVVHRGLPPFRMVELRKASSHRGCAVVRVAKTGTS